MEERRKFLDNKLRTIKKLHSLIENDQGSKSFIERDFKNQGLLKVMTRKGSLNNKCWHINQIKLVHS